MNLLSFLKIVGVLAFLVYFFAILFNIKKIRKCRNNGGGLIHFFTGAKVGRPCTKNNMCSTFKCTNNVCAE